MSGKRSRGSNGVDWALADECSRDSNLSWSGDSTRLSNPAALAAGEDRSLSSSSKASRLLQSRAKADKALKEQNPDILKEKFASIARVPKVCRPFLSKTGLMVLKHDSNDRLKLLRKSWKIWLVVVDRLVS